MDPLGTTLKEAANPSVQVVSYSIEVDLEKDTQMENLTKGLGKVQKYDILSDP